MKLKVEFVFAWYDFWIGLFWDRKKRWLYVMILPTVGFVVKFPEKKLPELFCDCGQKLEHRFEIINGTCDGCMFHDIPEEEVF